MFWVWFHIWFCMFRLFKSARSICSPGLVQMLPGINQMQALRLLIPYVCLSSLASKSGCSCSLVHVRHSTHCTSTPALTRLPRFPIPIDLFATFLLGVLARSKLVWLWRSLIPIHKLMLEDTYGTQNRTGHPGYPAVQLRSDQYRIWVIACKMGTMSTCAIIGKQPALDFRHILCIVANTISKSWIRKVKFSLSQMSSEKRFDCIAAQP